MRVFKSLTNIYLLVVSILGIFVFMLNSNFTHYNTFEWMTIFSLTCSAILLNYFIIELPPNGNRLSMDSSIFLASLYLYGLQLTLHVLLIYALIFAVTQRKIQWWKHVFNFSMYTLMIFSTFYMYHFSGGIIGNTALTRLLPYLVSLSVYFMANVIILGCYFLITDVPDNLLGLLKGIIQETLLQLTFAPY